MPSRSRVAADLALALLCLGLYFLSPHLRDFWVPDEPRYAAIAEHMVASGDVLIPRLNGQVYSDKPPLFFWALALLRALAGRGSAALYSLPAAASALAAVLLLARWGRERLGERAGTLAALVLATSALWLGLGQAVRMDIPFALAVSAALLLYLRRDAEGRGPGPAFWVLLGAATLLKGPVGLLVPLLVVLADCALRRDGARLRSLGLPWGLPLALGVVGVWLVPALLEGGRPYAEAVFFKQTLHRAVRSWAHREPAWFYLVRLPLLFAPWSAFLAAAVLAGDAGLDAAARRTRRFCLLWVGVWLGFFSAVSGKLEVYLLPLFPPAALLVGELCDRVAAGRGGARARRLFDAAAGAVVVALGYAGWRVGEGDLAAVDYIRSGPGAMLLLGAALVVLSLLLLRRRIAVAAALAGMMCAVLVFVMARLVPLVDATYSGAGLARQAGAAGPGPARLGSWGAERPELSWWMRASVTPLDSVERLREFLLWSPRALVVARKSGYDRLRDTSGLPLVRAAELRLGHEELVLFRLKWEE